MATLVSTLASANACHVYQHDDSSQPPCLANNLETLPQIVRQNLTLSLGFGGPDMGLQEVDGALSPVGSQNFY